MSECICGARSTARCTCYAERPVQGVYSRYRLMEAALKRIAVVHPSGQGSGYVARNLAAEALGALGIECHAPQECPTPDLCSDSEGCAWPGALADPNTSPFRVPHGGRCTCHESAGSFGCEVHGDA